MRHKHDSGVSQLMREIRSSLDTLLHMDPGSKPGNLLDIIHGIGSVRMPRQLCPLPPVKL